MKRPARTLAALFPVALLAAASLVPSSLIFGAERPQTIRPVPTPALSARSTISDVQAAYDAMEKAIEREYWKLIQEARSEKSSLENQIKELEKQVETLKAQAKADAGNAAKLAQINQALESLKQKIKALKSQIKLLDQEIEKLEKQKDAEISKLRKQKATALEQAAKSRPASTPTPTPARK
ncbi:MAG TPA: hypothetical protein PLB01_03675 [Thermoanaerobaculia bacterium]|nr:hypothetical protein [Thermoanaerobaculia bacterium]